MSEGSTHTNTHRLSSLSFAKSSKPKGARRVLFSQSKLKEVLIAAARSGDPKNLLLASLAKQLNEPHTTNVATIIRRERAINNVETVVELANIYCNQAGEPLQPEVYQRLKSLKGRGAVRAIDENEFSRILVKEADVLRVRKNPQRYLSKKHGWNPSTLHKYLDLSYKKHGVGKFFDLVKACCNQANPQTRRNYELASLISARCG